MLQFYEQIKKLVLINACNRHAYWKSHDKLT